MQLRQPVTTFVTMMFYYSTSSWSSPPPPPDAEVPGPPPSIVAMCRRLWLWLSFKPPTCIKPDASCDKLRGLSSVNICYGRQPVCRAERPTLAAARRAGPSASLTPPPPPDAEVPGPRPPGARPASPARRTFLARGLTGRVQCPAEDDPPRGRPPTPAGHLVEARTHNTLH